MPYLTRRVRLLLDQWKSGQLQLAPEVSDQIANDLSAVDVDENGDPLLETVSDRLRAFARAYYLISERLDRIGKTDTATVSPGPSTTTEHTVDALRELFSHFERIFCSYTNSRPELFTRGQDFATAIRALGRACENDLAFAKRTLHAGNAAMHDLVAFYKKKGMYLFNAAREFGGLKAVLGGTQNFTRASEGAVRSMVLYSDTVMIADPIYKWMEVERSAEAFPLPRLLEDLMHLLPLKPLVDAALPIPPILVFPSFEGYLDRNDVQTQDAQEQMLMQFFGHYFNVRFDDLSEIFDYAYRQPQETIEVIGSSRLLIAPGLTGDEPLDVQLEAIRDHNQKFRSQEYQRGLDRLPPAALMLNTIMERLAPIYHMNENADALNANPLMAQSVHWHYYELLATASKDSLQKEDALPPDILDISKELTSQERCWFGNVPVDVLVDLRRRGEYLDFRRKLGTALADLRASTRNNVASNVVMVERALRQVSIEHHREMANLEARYKRTYTPLAIGGWVTIAASFLPYFPPLTVAAGVAALVGYLGGKAQELMERRQLGRTLTGILAGSARSKQA